MHQLNQLFHIYPNPSSTQSNVLATALLPMAETIKTPLTTSDRGPHCHPASEGSNSRPFAVQTASGPEAEPKSKDRSALKRRAREAGSEIGQLLSKNVTTAKEKHISDPRGTFWNWNSDCTTEAFLPRGKWPSLLSTYARLSQCGIPARRGAQSNCTLH